MFGLMLSCYIYNIIKLYANESDIILIHSVFNSEKYINLKTEIPLKLLKISTNLRLFLKQNYILTDFLNLK